MKCTDVNLGEIPSTNQTYPVCIWPRTKLFYAYSHSNRLKKTRRRKSEVLLGGGKANPCSAAEKQLLLDVFTQGPIFNAAGTKQSDLRNSISETNSVSILQSHLRKILHTKYLGTSVSNKTLGSQFSALRSPME
jgi:hypothetical protein